MNFGSKLNRVRIQADRLFLRTDKTDVVGELRIAEEQADDLRILCEAFYRSLEKRLNTHSVIEEKKHRKVPENQVAETLKEALKEVTQNQSIELVEKPLFRTIFEEIVAVEQLLGKSVLDYEEEVEARVLNPIHRLLKEDFPSIAKQRKALKQAGQDLDTAKAKLRNSQTNVTHTTKLDSYREEVEEAENKLDNMRDSYACDLFSVLGKEREIAGIFVLYLEMKLDHLQQSLMRLSGVLPPVRNFFENSTCSPVYGIPLHEHLRFTLQEIAFPIQVCIKRMIEVGMREEGLLRMAGSNVKIKRLKGLFDAGFVTQATISGTDYKRDYDIHVIAGAFKSYLRELPEPLLTHVKHDELVEAVRRPDHGEKLRSLWQVINTLPPQNLANLRYVMKFLSLLASYSSENKMTPNNIAIVMAPNLIGSHKAEDSENLSFGRNITLGNDYRLMVEQLIEYCDYFFKEKVDFGVEPICSEPPPSPTRMDSGEGSCMPRTTFTHRRTGSSDFSANAPFSQSYIESDSPKQPHRMKKKPAPLPPQGKGDEAFQAMAEQVRSKTPPPHMSSSLTSLSNHSDIMSTSVGSTPTPSALRLQHNNSIRRPTAEPPKPPLTPQPTPAKPPRPSPPFQPSQGSNDGKPPRYNSPVMGVKSLPAEVHSSPLGFEIKPSPICTSGIELSGEIELKDLVPVEDSEAAPVGFVDPSESEVTTRKEEGINAAAGSEFRKSLEGVFKNQPQTQPPRHLVKAGPIEASFGETQENQKVPFQLPAFPPSAVQRLSTDGASDKPESVRPDKPLVPEKPIINKPVIATDSSKPVIPEKPSIIPCKAVGGANNFQGVSVSTVIAVSAKESESSAKEEAICQVDSKDKPSKPPKPSKPLSAAIEPEDSSPNIEVLDPPETGEEGHDGPLDDFTQL